MAHKAGESGRGTPVDRVPHMEGSPQVEDVHSETPSRDIKHQNRHIHPRHVLRTLLVSFRDGKVYTVRFPYANVLVGCVTGRHHVARCTTGLV